MREPVPSFLRMQIDTTSLLINVFQEAENVGGLLVRVVASVVSKFLRRSPRASLEHDMIYKNLLDRALPHANVC